MASQSAACTSTDADTLFEQRQQMLERTLSLSGLLSDDEDEPECPQRSRRQPNRSSQCSTASNSSAASTPSRRPFRTAKALLDAEAELHEALPPVENKELDRFWRIMSRRRLSFLEAAAIRSTDVVVRCSADPGAEDGSECVAALADIAREAERAEEAETKRRSLRLCGRDATRFCGRSMASALLEETYSMIGGDLGDRFEEYSRMLDEVDFGEPLPASASPWRAA